MRATACFTFLMIILLIPVSQLSAQNSGSIIGKVSDARSLQPLIGANVTVIGTTRGASTNLAGEYEISNVPLGSQRLRFEYLGYESVLRTDIMVISATPVQVDASLEPGLLSSEVVTVSAGYFNQEVKTQTSTLGLTREEIRRFPGGFEDIVRTVSTLPGVAINAGGGRNDLLVRGGGPSENLYLINNIEVPNINHFGTQGTSGGSLSFVNLDFIKDVTFSTGGFSARFGDKMSSVLALRMTDEIPPDFSGKATVSASQYGLNFKLPLRSRGSVIVSARKSYLDLIFRAAGLAFVPVYTDFNIIANYNPTRDNRFFLIGLSAINTIDRELGTLQQRVENAALMDNSQYQGITGLNYRRLLEHGYLDLTLASNLYRYRLSQADPDQVEYFRSHSDEWEHSQKIQHYLVVSPRLGLRSGIAIKLMHSESSTTFADSIYDRSGNQLDRNDLGLPGLQETADRLWKQAAFAEIEWFAHPRLDINAGLRADYYSFLEEELYLAPRISLRYKLSERLSIRTGGGIYFQSPAYVWLNNPANRKLKALQNRMLIGGCDYLCRDDLRFSLEGYYKSYSDLPSGVLTGVTDYIVQTNTGTGFGGREDDFQSFGYYELSSTATADAFGAELLVQKKFSELPLYGLMSFSWGKSTVKANNGLTYPGQYDQRFIFNLTAGYIFNAAWEVSGKFRYFTGVPFTPVYRPSKNPLQNDMTQNLPVEYLTDRTPPGHHLDLRMDRYFNFSSWTLICYIDIQNIYNYPIPQRPFYDFWEDKISTSSDIGILPSIGVSVIY